jgi:DNA uptake protein ComE-like DNA-binding protein
MKRTWAWIVLLGFLVSGCSMQAQTAANPGNPPIAAPIEPLVDINRASAEELKQLPGIADAYAAAIIRHRPYKNKAQLATGKVIPPAAYKKIRDRIIAKQ